MGLCHTVMNLDGSLINLCLTIMNLDELLIDSCVSRSLIWMDLS